MPERFKGSAEAKFCEGTKPHVIESGVPRWAEMMQRPYQDGGSGPHKARFSAGLGEDDIAHAGQLCRSSHDLMTAMHGDQVIWCFERNQAVSFKRHPIGGR